MQLIVIDLVRAYWSTATSTLKGILLPQWWEFPVAAQPAISGAHGHPRRGLWRGNCGKCNGGEDKEKRGMQHFSELIKGVTVGQHSLK